MACENCPILETCVALRADHTREELVGSLERAEEAARFHSLSVSTPGFQDARSDANLWVSAQLATDARELLAAYDAAPDVQAAVELVQELPDDSGALCQGATPDNLGRLACTSKVRVAEVYGDLTGGAIPSFMTDPTWNLRG